MVKLRKIRVEKDDHMGMRGQALKEAIEKDKEKGLIPFYVSSPIAVTFLPQICIINTIKKKYVMRNLQCVILKRTFQTLCVYDCHAY